MSSEIARSASGTLDIAMVLNTEARWDNPVISLPTAYPPRHMSRCPIARGTSVDKQRWAGYSCRRLSLVCILHSHRKQKCSLLL